MSVTYQYDVPDVMCGNCSGTIENTLRQTLFFKDQIFGVDPLEKKLTITLEDDHLSYFEICDLLNECLEPVGFSCAQVNEDKRIKNNNAQAAHRLKGVAGIGVGSLLLLISLFNPVLPMSLMFAATVLSTALTLYLGKESYQKAWKKLKVRALTMDSLFAISTITILGISAASLFFPILPMMCDAGLLIFGFRHVGLAVEHAFKKNQAFTQRFQDDAPQWVMVVKPEGKRRVPLSDIQKNDVLFLQEGDILPVDGIFEEENGLISDRIVTGSNMPRAIVKGETLYAGSILTQANKPLLFKATAAALSSHLAKLDMKVARAKLEKSTLETATNRILQYFIPGIIFIAILSGISIGLLFSPALGLQCAVAVLVSACPCTLGLITPLAIRIGIKKAADAGVVFNSAKKLEDAAEVQCVVFDLNGTLTQGMPRVIRHRALLDSGLSQDEFIHLMAHFEKDCAHPVAKAIASAATVKKTEPITSDVTIEMTDHAGRVLIWNGLRYILGSESLLLQQGVVEQDIEHVRKSAQLESNESIIYLARGSQLIGYVVVQDALRKDAVQVIASIKNPYICTGSDLKTALQAAKKLGIPADHVRANCVSHANADSVRSKKNVLDELRKKGFRVAAVGDGGNDAEMIAAADVGFAISAGGDLHTQQQASAVIQGYSLLPVLHAFSIAKRTVSHIKQNLIFSLIYNAATVFLTGGLLLTIGIAVNPAIGAALMILQTSLILMNVYRFAKQPAIIDETPKLHHPQAIRSVPQLLQETSKPLNQKQISPVLPERKEDKILNCLEPKIENTGILQEETYVFGNHLRFI